MPYETEGHGFESCRARYEFGSMSRAWGSTEPCDGEHRDRNRLRGPSGLQPGHVVQPDPRRLCRKPPRRSTAAGILAVASDCGWRPTAIVRTRPVR